MTIDPYPAGTIGIVCILKDGPQSIASGGSVAFVTAFFQTVATKLEGGDWGSQFPVLMNDFYLGEYAGVTFEKAQAFRREIEAVQEAFHGLSASDIVWNVDFDQSEANLLAKERPLDEVYAKLFADLSKYLDGLEISKGGKIILMSARKYFDS
jgi:hypothetical protein